VSLPALVAAGLGPGGPVGSRILDASVTPTPPVADATSSTAIEIVFALLIAATILAIAARRLGIPYPIVLVLGGLAIGFVPGLPAIELAPNVVFLLFLPPILFAAGYFTSIRDLRANIRPVALLAVGLVLFTTAVVAAVAHTLVPGMGWAAAFALGAIVAPPDAAAATSVFERLGVPRRIVTILEGESLLNDATALVAYRFAVVAAGATAGAFSIVDVGSTFVIASVGGAVLGLAMGILTALFVRRIDDPVFSVVVTFLAPLIAYLPAERLGLSGVLATVVAGIYVGRKAPRLLSSAVRLSAVAAWQVLLFLINGAVFILIGVQLPRVLASLGGQSPGELLGLAVAISAAVIVARMVWVIPTSFLPHRLRRSAHGSDDDPDPKLRNLVLVGWAGMRGVVSLAAALALPGDFPQRDLVIFLAFAVILATLVGQGLTLPFLINRLEIDDGGGDGNEEAYARIAASDAAVGRLDQLQDEWPDHRELIDTLRAQYGHRSHHAELRRATEDADDDTNAEQELLEHRQIRVAVLNAERAALLTLRERGAISDEVHRRVERDLDLEELRMEV
jgi:monovalent cation/hydrogen antiporter